MSAVAATHFPMAIPASATALRSVSRSHVGLVRAINEDRVFDCAERGLWAIVDGMGGHRGGDLAAQAVIDALRSLASLSDAITPRTLEEALHGAHRIVAARNAQTGFDAGATVVAILRDGATGHVAWAGDSRAYRVRDGRVALLTHDHSVVQELVDAGLIEMRAAARHPQANVVTRALGVHDALRLDRVTVDLLPGDRLLLCSDGLSRSLRDDDLAANVGLDAAADALLANALARDGSDNVSFVLVDIPASD